MSDADQYVEQVPDDSIQVAEERPVPVCFRTGRAGTGKSFWVMETTQNDPDFAVVTSTTGLSAVNLGATTINSILSYFDTLSMRDAYLTGRLTAILHKWAKRKRWFLVEEVSMMEAGQLDYLYRAMQEANRFKDVTQPMGIYLVGDFAQLPPVKGEWAFEAPCWPEFERNTVRMDKVWRQQDGLFLDALNHAREGRGGACAEVLTAAGIEWHSSRIVEFEGTTILSKNDQVSRHNQEVLKGVKGEAFVVTSERWGMQRSEWGENPRTHEWGIPKVMPLKLGAYVMLLANKKGFEYVNGDCGWIRQYDHEREVISVELIRTGKVAEIGKQVMDVATPNEPAGWQGETLPEEDSDVGWLPRQHHYAGGKYVLGQVKRFPMRLAYASTVHRSQGLSLDRVQCDLRDRFWESYAMAYVALSRARTFEGLRVVIDKDTFVRRVNADPKVRAWL